MKHIMIISLAGLLAAGLSGCSRPEQVTASEPLCLPQIDADRAMLAARTVLEQMQFSIEKFDLDVRYLRTRPLSGAQFFQVWRSDNATAFTGARANMQTLQRVVEIQATPYPDRTCLECRVFVQKLSLPERPIEGVRSTPEIYTNSDRSNQTLELDNSQLQRMEWLDEGQDAVLEQEILNKVRKKVTS